jgi:hypothetical protein
LRRGRVPQLRKPFGKRNHAFLVPQITASEHCNECNAADRTIDRRGRY